MSSSLRGAVRFPSGARPGHGGGAAAAAAAAVSAAGLSPVGLSPVGLSPVGLSSEAATAWAYDASTCVICMDRMESQVLTTVCNHSFHVDCLMKWQDSPCPVCRFHHNNASEASTCQVRACASPFCRQL